MNVLSLFDGMSCGQITLKELGIKVYNYYASEIDSDAIKVTQNNFPNTIQLGSVTELKHIDWSIDNIDLLIGGSPCQSFSRSGDGTGFNGKSGLFFEYVRVLKEIQKVNPNLKFMLENVVMKKEWEDIITKELGVEPIKIDSKLVSAQKRQRLYWTNINNINQPKDLKTTTRDIIDTNNTNIVEMPIDFMWIENGEYRVRNATKQGYLVVNDYDVVNLDFPNSKTRRGRVSKQKSNTLNTSCNQAIFLDGKLIKLSALECKRLQTIPDWYKTDFLSESKQKQLLGNGWTVEVIKHILKQL